jgi:hypothetical protein
VRLKQGFHAVFLTHGIKEDLLSVDFQQGRRFTEWLKMSKQTQRKNELNTNKLKNQIKQKIKLKQGKKTRNKSTISE